MKTTKSFVTANVKQLQTYTVLEFCCLFSRTYYGFGVINSIIFKIFHKWNEFGTILEVFGISGDLNTPSPLGTPLGEGNIGSENNEGLSKYGVVAPSIVQFSLTSA